MNQSQLIQANIANLTNLWTTMGASCQQINQTRVHKSNNWPYRMWVDGNNSFNPDEIDHLLTELDPLPIPTIFPVWDTPNAKLVAVLKEHQFEVSFKQTAMVLNLSDLNISELEQSTDLVFKQANTTEEVNDWVDISSRAFGYSIYAPVVHSIVNKSNVILILAYKNDIPVATTLMFDDSDVIGIHSVGVAPSHRRQGIARYIMYHVLNIAKQSGRDYATLQASALGQPLYTQLGFIQQFVMTSFAKR